MKETREGDFLEHLRTSRLQYVCRICLNVFSDSELNSIIDEKEEGSLKEKFTFVTSIHVDDDGRLPTNICLVCSTELINSFIFKTKSLESENILEFFLKHEDDNVNNIEEKKIIPCNIQTYNDYQIKDENILKEEVEYLEDLSDDGCQSPRLILTANDAKTENEHNVAASVSVSESQLNMTQKPAKKYSNRKRNSLECKVCSKIFLKQKTLRAHVNKEHGPTLPPNGCNICKEAFASEHDLMIHLSIHQSKDGWKCNECGKEFKDKTTLRRHVSRHMEVKRYQCTTCDKTFTELYALKRHIRVHTGESVEKKHKCNICDKRYNAARVLATHLARHAGLRPFVCAVCGKTFLNSRLLASHRLIHTDRKQYACEYCDKRFRHESTRNTHHRTHTGEKPYICSYCGKRFIQSSNLSLHLRTHTGERPYNCDICQKNFSSGSTLKAHRRIHTGEKPYSCEICGMRFSRMDKSAHMRKHTGERPFECSVCFKKFGTSSTLKEHQRLHTGEKPFECDMCSTKFASKSRLAKHIKAHQAKMKTLRQSKPKLLYLQPVTELKFLPNKIQYYKKEKEDTTEIDKDDQNDTTESYRNISVIMETPHEVPMEVSRELIINPNGETKAELLVIDEGSYQNNFCLAGNLDLLNEEVKFVTVDSDASIPATSMIAGTAVKFMQVDQSLLQIQSDNGQVTVSKITSKMTANF